ncbi:hypothetical protein Gpo141_00010821 [Globisporangium polare]
MPLRRAIRHLQASVANRQHYNRGQYSIERLCALKHYTDRTSAIRVLLVSVLTIALSLLAILALDVIPLQDPASGWQNNYSMWFRVFTGSFMLAIGVTFQLQKLAPEAHFTLWKGVRVGFFTGAGNCVASIAIASSWVFPVPFLAILTMPIWLTLFCSGIVFTVGLDNWKQNPELVTQLKRYATKLYIESNLLLIYPAYNVVYSKLTGISQFAFIFVLPVIKYILKKIMKGVVEDLEDLVPVVVITVDLFNALYQSKCMQSSSSMLTTAGIIIIDAIQNVHALRQLFEYMRNVEELTNDEIYAQGVLTYALRLVNEPLQLDSKELSRIRVNSTCASMALSKEQSEMLQRMQTIQEQTVKEDSDGRVDDRSQDSSRENQSGSEKSGSPSYSAVIPWIKESSALPAEKPKPSSMFPVRSTKIMPSIAVKPTHLSRELNNKEKAMILTKTLELLWKCERLLLVEYVESAIPLLYAAYLAILSQLPNAKYYPGISKMSPETLDRVIMSILVYGSLELLSLLYVHAILRWKFRISPLHQLAFALENEWLIIQGMLVAWVVVILQFTLVHYGIDFTFQFDWIAKNRGE